MGRDDSAVDLILNVLEDPFADWTMSVQVLIFKYAIGETFKLN